MNGPSYGSLDPIAALASPPGESALALIRTSGGPALEKSALELLAGFFSRPKKLREAPGNTIVYGCILSAGGEKIDEVLISVYRAPGSYTGEDGADITCHGGPAAVRAVLETLRAAGFRDALRGEFTFRAFMNGKLDLTRCESVMELVSAKTSRGREHAVRRLAGALEEEISGIKNLLVETLAGLEIHLDYSEDDGLLPDGIEDSPELPGRALAEEALSRLEFLADTWRRERLYHQGALAVIAGRPNAGKSSLFNYLVNEERSIVTDIPGTTRDWIEGLISLEGIQVRLADTAGLRAAGDNAVEEIGISRSRELLGEADLVLYVIDGVNGIHSEDEAFLRDQGSPRIVLWNKADREPLPPDLAGLFPGPFLAVSAKTGRGIPALLRLMAGTLESAAGEGSDSPGIATFRQKELTDRALASVREALGLADRGEALDIIAPLVRDGVNALGEITGEVSTEDILETMFSRFCVGK